MKLHLLISGEPLTDGLDRIALCGEIIPKASAVPFSEVDPQSSIMFCKSCFGKSYLYIVSDGETALKLRGAE